MAGEPTTRPFTVDEYYRMVEAGILGEDDRVELLDGEIVQMSPIGSRHAESVDRFSRWLFRLPSEAAVVRVQNPVRLHERSEPQPDLCLARPRPGGYARGHPEPEDILLIVEVAETSLRFHRDRKVPAYARAGVPEAWLADLDAGRVLEFRDPRRDGYRSVRELRPGDSIAPLAFPDLLIPVADVLP